MLGLEILGLCSSGLVVFGFGQVLGPFSRGVWVLQEM